MKIADKTSNIQDIIAGPPPGWSRERRHAYIGWAEQVVDRIRGTNEALERAFDELAEQGKHHIGPISDAHDRAR